MISYFKYGKGKLDICEDSLTASVFDLLKFLHTDLFWHILKQALHQDHLPNYCNSFNIELNILEKLYNIKIRYNQ